MFEVCDSKGNTVTVQDVSAANKYDDFFCPTDGCNCIYHYRAYESNRKKAHFFKLPSSSHSPNCTVQYGENSGGGMDHFDAQDSSVDDVLSSVTTPSKNNPRKKIRTPSHQHSKSDDTPKKIRTLRQLYNFCIQNDINTIIGNRQIRDFFVGQKTAFLYTKYCSGIALVEARFHSYHDKNKQIADDDNRLFFTYPFNVDKNAPYAFKVTVHIADEALYKAKRNELFDLYYKKHAINPVLILSEWQHSNCQVTVSKQILPL